MFFSESELSIELLGVFKIQREKHFNRASHERSYETISIRLSGTGKFETDDTTFSTKKGDILYLPKNLNYTQKSDGETIIAIHFINYSFKKDNKAEIANVEDIDYVEKLVGEMYDVWKEKKQGHKYKCTMMLYELLYYINCQQYSQVINSVSHDVKIKKAIDYIHSNFRNSNISISQLADMCNVSETYFRKIFKQIHQISPKQYIIDLKLEYAQHLLRSQLYTVSEAGYKSGFADLKYFSRLFKKYYGVPPKEYQGGVDK